MSVYLFGLDNLRNVAAFVRLQIGKTTLTSSETIYRLSLIFNRCWGLDNFATTDNKIVCYLKVC